MISSFGFKVVCVSEPTTVLRMNWVEVVEYQFVEFYKLVLGAPVCRIFFTNWIIKFGSGTIRHQPFGRHYCVGHMSDKSVDQMGSSN